MWTHQTEPVAHGTPKKTLLILSSQEGRILVAPLLGGWGSKGIGIRRSFSSVLFCTQRVGIRRSFSSVLFCTQRVGIRLRWTSALRSRIGIRLRWTSVFAVCGMRLVPFGE